MVTRKSRIPWCNSRLDPQVEKGYHRDTCVVLDAANIYLVSVSNHHFVPGLLEVVNYLTVVQEIVEELLVEFAGETCVLLRCCPNFYPKATEYVLVSKQSPVLLWMFWNRLGSFYTH